MSRLKLTLACWDYDRTRGLADGSVRCPGLELNCITLPVEETFFRMLRFGEFDAAEMSLSSYVLSLASEPSPFVAIPVFPSRSFRHSSIYVHAGAGIEAPADLVGKKVGLPTYEMTAAVWIRGILDELYDVPFSSIHYHTGGLEDASRTQIGRLTLPAEIQVSALGPGETLATSVADGTLDAIYSARAPSTFGHDRRVERLFPDFQGEEEEYFQRTRVFPIMHVIVIRRAFYEQHPWVARSLLDGFASAQSMAYAALGETGSLRVMLPWLNSHLRNTMALMGTDYWAYGLDANRHTLNTFLTYAERQGLNPTKAVADDLFLPSTLTSYAI